MLPPLLFVECFGKNFWQDGLSQSKVQFKPLVAEMCQLSPGKKTFGINCNLIFIGQMPILNVETE